MKQSFREITLNALLSKKLQNFDKIISIGERKKRNCIFYNGNFCVKFRVGNNAPASWVSNSKMDPHPVFCYVCPYFSSRDDEGEVVLDLLDIYLYYKEIEKNIERELKFLESRKKDYFLFGTLGLDRRREELLVLLEDLKEKENILKELITIVGLL
ncbi:MAG: hypothetical protein OWQ54_08400 [Sulfolobaceae archaeon]|nr:hypothetical protein [Sulfolobaceae archaeon]